MKPDMTFSDSGMHKGVIHCERCMRRIARVDSINMSQKSGKRGPEMFKDALKLLEK